MTERGGGVLIDTSAWIEALRRDGDASVRERVRAVVTDDAAVLCDMVVLELWNGARGQHEAEVLGQLVRDIRCLPTTEEAWRTASSMARNCRQEGVTVPATDLLVAACAQTHGASLLHCDSHFDLIARAVSSD
jgi:predicted nucleic acid-binding protein